MSYHRYWADNNVAAIVGMQSQHGLPWVMGRPNHYPYPYPTRVGYPNPHGLPIPMPLPTWHGAESQKLWDATSADSLQVHNQPDLRLIFQQPPSS